MRKNEKKRNETKERQQSKKYTTRRFANEQYAGRKNVMKPSLCFLSIKHEFQLKICVQTYLQHAKCETYPHNYGYGKSIQQHKDVRSNTSKSISSMSLI